MKLVLAKNSGANRTGCNFASRRVPTTSALNYEVVCILDEGNREACDYAFRCEAEALTTLEEVGMEAPKPARRARQ